MSKDIWLDITTSTQWTGGVVGIVRAELEIAAALSHHYPNIRFSKFYNGRFEEISKSDLPWLHGDQNVAEAYLIARNQSDHANSKDKLRNREKIIEEHFQQFATEIPSRARRLQRAMLLGLSALPYSYQRIGLVLTWPTRKLMGLAVRIHLFLHSLRNSTIVASAYIEISPTELTYPYKKGDLVVSLGWLDSGKEVFYSKLKERDPGIALAYMVYDTILIGESTHHLYRPQEESSFRKYFHWISETCDFILYAGKSPQRDGEYYQKKFGWKTPPSLAISYGGTDLAKKTSYASDDQVLKNLGINGRFILSVGTIEVRKNHDTLYKAIVSLVERNVSNLPQMVFAGRPGWRTADLIDTINRDPRISGKLLLLTPSDAELDTLYRNCLFTLLPSFYEGWSLPMPEGLSYGKLCLASNVEPLREIGGEVPEYIHPLDVMGWANKIEFYSNNSEALKIKEKRIHDEWQGTSWDKCGQDVLAALQDFSSRLEYQDNTINLWVDLTLSYAVWRGGVTGIIRSELMLAHYLESILSGVKFFAFHDGKFFEIPRDKLIWLFRDTDVNSNYAEFQRFWAGAESTGHHHRVAASNSKAHNLFTQRCIPELCHLAPSDAPRKSRILTAGGYVASTFPPSIRKFIIKISDYFRNKSADSISNSTNSANQEHHKTEVSMDEFFQKSLSGIAQDLPFGGNDMVFSAGINWDQTPLIELIKAKRKSSFHFSQVIYDLTPLNTPHLHAKEAYDWYQKFFYLAGLASDKVIYGGETAMRDGKKWQAEHGWQITPGLPIKFGSDIAPQTDHSKDKEILLEMGVTGQFLLSVGTLEIRKNHDTLYKAYLKLLEDNVKNLPQLVFVGGAGWKAQDLFEVISRDERVKSKILILRTTDQQLDVLYRYCQFTLLPSLYEGWSLTLPESLGYGKFCLASDVDPLRETGRDLVDYVHPWDVVGWAEKIKFYSSNPEELSRREKCIRNEWNAITWKACANTLVEYFELMVKDSREEKNEK